MEKKYRDSYIVDELESWIDIQFMHWMMVLSESLS